MAPKLIKRLKGFLTGKEMKKLKSFTLIEIIIAAVIFAVVAIVASASLSMIVASNNKTDDLTSNENCIRQVSDYIKGAASVDHFGQRVRVVVASGTTFRLKEFGKISTENTGDYRGIAFFNSAHTFRVVYKQNGIYGVSGSIDYIRDDFDYSFPAQVANVQIHSNDCRFFTGSPTGWDMKDANNQNIYNFDNPFQITRYKHIQAGDTPAELSLSRNRAYVINVRDVAYRASDIGVALQSQSDANSSNIFSRLDLTISERDMAI